MELDAKLPRVLKGEAQPADAAERLDLAQMCQLPGKSLNAAAVRFYTDAFAAEPKVADDLGAAHRYNAACAAALAGVGQGQDARDLDDKGRARLRQRALDWLRADLAACGRVLGNGPEQTRPLALGRLRALPGGPRFRRRPGAASTGQAAGVRAAGVAAALGRRPGPPGPSPRTGDAEARAGHQVTSRPQRPAPRPQVPLAQALGLLPTTALTAAMHNPARGAEEGTCFGSQSPRASIVASPRNDSGKKLAHFRPERGTGSRRRSKPPTQQENAMWFTPRLKDRHPSARKHARRSPVKPRAFHPRSELLEGRALLSTLTVTNTLDSGHGSLRYEIAHANKNATIVFAPSLDGQTITLTSGELDITTGLTIQGPGAGQLTISGGNNSRVFEVNASAPVVLSGLTISGATDTPSVGWLIRTTATAAASSTSAR